MTCFQLHEDIELEDEERRGLDGSLPEQDELV